MVEWHFSGVTIVVKSEGIFDLIALKSLFTDEEIKAREEKPPAPDHAEKKRNGTPAWTPTQVSSSASIVGFQKSFRNVTLLMVTLHLY